MILLRIIVSLKYIFIIIVLSLSSQSSLELIPKQLEKVPSKKQLGFKLFNCAKNINYSKNSININRSRQLNLKKKIKSSLEADRLMRKKVKGFI